MASFKSVLALPPILTLIVNTALWSPFTELGWPGINARFRDSGVSSTVRWMGANQQWSPNRIINTQPPATDAPIAHSNLLTNEQCGEWFWEGPYGAKDLRVLPTKTGEETLPECGAVFTFENVTGLPGVSDYSLELDTREENTVTEWTLPYPDEEANGAVFLIPTLGADLSATPIDPSQPATVSIRGRMTASSLGPDLGLYILRNLVSLVSLTGDPLFCAAPEEQLYLGALKAYYSGAIDQALDLLFDLKLAEAWRQLGLAFDNFIEQLLIEANLDCSIEALALILGAVVVKTKLLLAVIAYSVTVINDYRRFQGQPSETLLRYYPPQANDVSPTEVVFFVPTTYSGQDQYGECWTVSIAASREGAWRCTSQTTGILDPCFSHELDQESVICNPVPWAGRSGFRLILTEPLPTFEPLTGTYAWYFELEDGTTCFFLSTGTTIFTQIDEPILYGCDDGWVILDVPIVDVVWTAEKARLSADYSRVEETETVNIRKVWR